VEQQDEVPHLEYKYNVLDKTELRTGPENERESGRKFAVSVARASQLPRTRTARRMLAGPCALLIRGQDERWDDH
jgi:hypothetical protein